MIDDLHIVVVLRRVPLLLLKLDVLDDLLHLRLDLLVQKLFLFDDVLH